MRDAEKERLCERIKTELFKIMDAKDITSNGLENAFKLMDMLKDIKNIEYWEQKGEYYAAILDDMQNEYSEARRRDSMGRYSRADGRMMPDYDRDSSYRSRRSGEHYVRGHYSCTGAMDGGYSGDHYDQYMDSKASYRSSKTPECKQRLMDTLEDYMDSFSRQMEEMLRDSDCAEERQTISRYLQKIKNLA